MKTTTTNNNITITNCVNNMTSGKNYVVKC